MGDLSLIAREPSNTATWHLYGAILGGRGGYRCENGPIYRLGTRFGLTGM